MDHKCRCCEHWERTERKKDWGVCHGQDLPQALSLSGKTLLETRADTGCGQFLPREETMRAEPWDHLDDLEDYAYDLLQDRQVRQEQSLAEEYRRSMS